MASAASTGSSLSDEERRWIVVGICLAKVLTRVLRTVLATELQNWHHRLCQPPDEIDKQDFTKYKKRKLAPSRFQLQYKNINNNDVHISPSAYDYAVKDPLSLAKLFVQPFMAKFTGFDQTMDLSAILAVVCNAKPFSSAAADAETVRKNIRNKWAHCNFSEWTQPVFTASIQGLKLFVKKINLSPADEKALCGDLDDWEKKGLGLCFGQPVMELVTELRTNVEMKAVKEKLNNLESNLLCRMEEVEKHAAENSKELKRQKEKLERQSNDKQKENYSDFADKKGLGLCFGQPVTELELRTSVETWKFESDAQIQRIALQRNEDIRLQFKAEISVFNANQLVFLDETGIIVGTATRENIPDVPMFNASPAKRPRREKH